MKKNITSFIAGMCTTALLSTATVTAFAADGLLTLSVQPARVLVNGEMFQPKDAAGRDALVFTYNGTTYAPVRALAEAYGLEVGYDAGKGLVTVGDLPAGDFASQWTVTEKPVTRSSEHVFTAVYAGPLDLDGFKAWWKSMDESRIRADAERMAAELQRTCGGSVEVYFSCQSYNLGTAYGLGSYELTNFNAAGVWIK